MKKLLFCIVLVSSSLIRADLFDDIGQAIKTHVVDPIKTQVVQPVEKKAEEIVGLSQQECDRTVYKINNQLDILNSNFNNALKAKNARALNDLQTNFASLAAQIALAIATGKFVLCASKLTELQNKISESQTKIISTLKSIK